MFREIIQTIYNYNPQLSISFFIGTTFFAFLGWVQVSNKYKNALRVIENIKLSNVELIKEKETLMNTIKNLTK